ncbi:MAG TPA: helix-turn-helix domain-containing protein [Streptosporangiaceae bacterium]|nr:helix-turn-helix domain-containing protein [Streptosporangiaceae bacterium]
MDSETVAAGTLLRQARKRAGLSQAELAARAGVTQSVISAYESGHRQPAIPALAALVDAAGYELVIGLRRQPRRLGRLSGPVGRRVRRHRNDLVAAAAAHGVKNLRVFGSVARGEDRPDSDVDLLADLPAGLSLFGLGRVAAELEDILGSRVDLIPAGDLKPGARARVERDLVAL